MKKYDTVQSGILRKLVSSFISYHNPRKLCSNIFYTVQMYTIDIFLLPQVLFILNNMNKIRTALKNSKHTGLLHKCFQDLQSNHSRETHFLPNNSTIVFKITVTQNLIRKTHPTDRNYR